MGVAGAYLVVTCCSSLLTPSWGCARPKQTPHIPFEWGGVGVQAACDVPSLYIENVT